MDREAPVTAVGPVAKVLLVDDRRDNLLALEAMLQGLPVEPVSVDSGEAALKQLLTEDFALILLDARMPRMDGFETATLVKRRERSRHIPIIFLTAADREQRLALQGYAAGAVDYLAKPFDPWVLRAKVSVFVELWAKSQQLIGYADRYARLSGAVSEAIIMLRGSNGSALTDDASLLLEAALDGTSSLTR